MQTETLLILAATAIQTVTAVAVLAKRKAAADSVRAAYEARSHSRAIDEITGRHATLGAGSSKLERDLYDLQKRLVISDDVRQETTRKLLSLEERFRALTEETARKQEQLFQTQTRLRVLEATLRRHGILPEMQDELAIRREMQAKEPTK